MNTDRLVDIYIITNLINGKQYVGQSVCGYVERFRQHCFCANRPYDTDGYIQDIDLAIKQYGIDNFKVELIEKVSFEERNNKEIYYIKKYNTYSKGYNRTIGGDFNPMFDSKVRQKHKEICSSEQHRQKSRESAIKMFSEREDIHKKITEGNKKAWQRYSKDEKEHILKGLKEYNKSRTQRVAMVDNDGNVLKEFDSASDACRYVGRDSGEAGNLLKTCNQYIKSGKRRVRIFGYSWIRL
mgnify:CR=1 FL=1